MRKLPISKGKSRRTNKISNGSVTWDELCKKLGSFVVTHETFDEYNNWDRDKQLEVKDVGFFIGGSFSGTKRRKEDLKFRSVVTLDVDHLTPDEMLDLELAYADCEYQLHSTHKHSNAEPRLRLVFPLSRDVTPEEYEPVARSIAAKLDMDVFDDTTFQPARVMFWPSRSSDGDEVNVHNSGRWIDPDDMMSGMDLEDPKTWPVSSRANTPTLHSQKVEDPLSKPGVIGAFNRTYDIHRAISEFDLPYTPGSTDNRYSFQGGTSSDGAVVHDFDTILYSHHESDPAFGHSVNAYDLVRLHRFGDLDAGMKNGAALNDRPSMKAMNELALEQDDVSEELFSFKDESDDDEIDLEAKPKKKRKIPTLESVIQQITDAMDTYPDGIDVFKRNELMKAMAVARLGPADLDAAADILKQVSTEKVSKASIVKQVQGLSRSIVTKSDDDDDGFSDIEIKILELTLQKHFGGGAHLKRVGKIFYHYQHGVWGKDDDERIKAALLETVVELRHEQPEEYMELAMVVGESKSSALVSQLWTIFCAYMAGRETDRDPLKLLRRFDHPIVNHLGGEIHYKPDGKVDHKRHDPEHFLVHQVPVTYDPKAKCPEWDRFMEMVFRDTLDPEENIRHLEEICGYVLSPYRWLKCYALFQGGSDAGKSTVGEVVCAMLGDVGVVNKSMSMFGAENKSNFSDYSLMRALLVLDDDFEKSALLPDGFLKKVSEEKTMSSDVKFGDEIRFVSRAFPMILSNHWPNTRDVTEALRDRTLVVPFTTKISKHERSDIRRNKMLTQELPGIFNRFLRGLARLRRRGDWSIPIDCVAAHQTWVLNSNPVGMFIKEMLGVDRGSEVEGHRMYRTYTHWCMEGHLPKCGRAEFYQRLEALNVKARHQGADVFFPDCKLLKDELDLENA